MVDNSGVDSTALIPFAFLSTLDHLALDFSKNQNQNQNCIYCWVSLHKSGISCGAKQQTTPKVLKEHNKTVKKLMNYELELTLVVK